MNLLLSKSGEKEWRDCPVRWGKILLVQYEQRKDGKYEQRKNQNDQTRSVWHKH